MNIIWANSEVIKRRNLSSKDYLGKKCYETYRNYDQICPDCKSVAVLKSKEAFQSEAKLSKGYWIDLRVVSLLPWTCRLAVKCNMHP
jgi:hypothetical protein